MTERDSDSGVAIGLLADQRRRYVLQCLDGRSTGMALADLATDVAALERDADPRDVSPDAIERVYVSLYHCHVPKLADGDVVDYREERNTVSLSSETVEKADVHQITDRAAARRRA